MSSGPQSTPLVRRPFACALRGGWSTALGVLLLLAVAGNAACGAHRAPWREVPEATADADASNTTDEGTVHDASPALDTSIVNDARNHDVIVMTDVTSTTDARGDDTPRCPIPFDATLQADVSITADDDYVLVVNGTVIDGTRRLWTAPQRYRVSLFRHPERRNVIAVQATNRLNIDGLDRGLVADFQWSRPTTGTVVRMHTDSAWRVMPGVVPDFGVVGLDDSAWPVAIDEGAHGIAPWGSVLGTSSAHWLWGYLANGSAASKPMIETMTFRRSFYLSGDRTVRETPEPCR